MRYGLPYQGSKNKLAKWIVDLLPKADHLYDVFAGGCAVTHCALLSGKWGCVHFSDINDSVVLFRDCLEGNIPDGSEWISREEFLRRRDTDPYVRLVWSFGNNQRSYIYSREIEPYKKAVHEMIFASTPTERRLKFREVCKLMSTVMGNPPYNTENKGGTSVARPRKYGEASEIMYRLQSEERRYVIKTPFCCGEYEMKIADYRDIEILPNSVIYCDIPYISTGGYRNHTFDHEAFYDWAEKQVQPVFISEYWMPEDRFVCIAEKERKSTFSPTNNKLSKIERIYVPKAQAEKYKKDKEPSLFDYN